MMNIKSYWHAVLHQDADAMRAYFAPGAQVKWHNTNEQFTVEEFIRANCEYPGDWDGEIEHTLRTDTHIITAVHVFSPDRQLSFHVTSFLRMEKDKIAAIDEYWGDDGDAPQWRKDLHLGSKIK